MKKVWCWLFLAVLFVSLAGAQFDEFQENLDQLEEAQETLADEALRSEFLRTEWNAFLEETPFGGIFEVLGTVLGFFDGFWNLALGIVFSYSWLFFLALLIWIFLLVFGFIGVSVLENVVGILQYSKYVPWGLFLVYFVIVSSVRVPLEGAELIIGLIATAESTAMQLIYIVVVCCAFIVALVFSSAISKYLHQLTRERKAKRDRETLGRHEQMIDDMRTRDNDEAVRRRLAAQAKAELGGIGSDTGF